MVWSKKQMHLWQSCNKHVFINLECGNEKAESTENIN